MQSSASRRCVRLRIAPPGDREPALSVVKARRRTTSGRHGRTRRTTSWCAP
jgi:hypothetical protein